MTTTESSIAPGDRTIDKRADRSGVLDRARRIIDAERRTICEALGDWYATGDYGDALDAAGVLECAIEDAGHVRAWASCNGWTEALTAPVIADMVDHGADWQIEAGDPRPAIVLAPEVIIR